MLADHIVASDFLRRNFGAGHRAFAESLCSAQKFDLGRDFVCAADSVTGTDATQRLRGFAKPPFEKTWIEFRSADRPSTNGPPEPGTELPGKIGALIETIGGGLHNVTWAWDHTIGNKRQTICLFGTVFDTDFHGFSELSNIELKYGGKIVTAMHGFAAIPCPYAAVYGSMIYQAERAGTLPAGTNEKMQRGMMNDLSSELRFLIGALALINCRNAVEARSVTPRPSRLDRLRRRPGKLPLFEHKVLTLRTPSGHPQWSEAEGQRQSDIRAHFVRGHFKVRRSGVYWWTPHVRGNAKLGFVSKDYRTH